MSDIKQVIRQEYLRCCKDPVHFMRKYCYIQHPQRGRIQFNLFPFQEKVLTLFQKHDYTAILKSRQLGISTLSAGYSLWLMTFHKDKNILALATTQATARNLVTKVQFMWKNLPSWLKVDSEENNKLSLRLSNGSKIQAKSSNVDAARSEAVSLLIIDEAAFIDNIAETWASAQQTLACIEENSIVYTSKGLYRIKDLYKDPQEGFNDLEISIFNRDNKIEKTTHFYKSPKSQTYKISFEDGNHLITTKEHPLLTQKEEWIQTQHLKPGDTIKCVYNQNTFGKPIVYPKYENEHFNTKPWSLNNIDLAYLIGLWVAEGSYGKRRINIATGDKPLQNWLESIGFKYGGRVNYNLSSNITYKLFKEFLQIPSGASNKLVPSHILASSKEEQIQFLSGCFDGDGCAHKKGISYVSTSKQLVLDIHIMLLNFGIKSKFKKVYWKKNKLVSVDSEGYRLDINKENSIKFYDNIGFKLERKQNNKTLLENIKDWGGINLNNINPPLISSLIKKSGYSLSGWNRKFTNIEGFLWRNNKNISKQATIQLLKNCNPSLPEYKELEYQFNLLDEVYYNEIISIEEHEEIETYDLKIPSSHSFIANNIVNHNTGGGAIVLSTPYGTGNWFHQTWVKAENRENDFLPIKLPWYVHPERDQIWRDAQDALLGDPRLAAQECDCDFSTSGDIVFYNENIEYYEKSFIKDPMERRGADKNLWVWESPDYTREYIVVADVARGDGKDNSACHVIDVENNVQVAEYKGQLGTKEFGHLLVGLATEYNEAMLVIENANIGWATIQVAIDRQYPNLYYSQKSDSPTANSYFDKYQDNSKRVAGFTMSSRTRPMVIGKFQEYVGDKGVTIQSKRLIEEMKTFIWRNNRAEAQSGYNDDLVMSFGIGMYIRDTALKLNQQGLQATKNALSSIKVNRTSYQGGYGFSQGTDNPYHQEIDGKQESIKWLL